MEIRNAPHIRVGFIEMKLGSGHTPVADAWTKKFPMGPEQRDSGYVSLEQTWITLYDIAHHCIALHLIINMYVVENLDFVKPLC